MFKVNLCFVLACRTFCSCLAALLEEPLPRHFPTPAVAVSPTDHRALCHRCRGSYYGARCDIDGEVLGAALGATAAAAVIIIATFICLCKWR